MPSTAFPTEVRPPPVKERLVKPPETGPSSDTRLHGGQQRIADLASGVTGEFDHLHTEHPYIDLTFEESALRLLQGELSTLNTLTAHGLKAEMEAEFAKKHPDLSAKYASGQTSSTETISPLTEPLSSQTTTSEQKDETPSLFRQDRAYFEEKYQQYLGYPMPVIKKGERYPRDPKTGQRIRPNGGNFDELPKDLRNRLGEMAKRISDERRKQGLPEILAHATDFGVDVIESGKLWERSHFGHLEDLAPDAEVVDTTIGNLHSNKPDFFVTTGRTNIGVDTPVDNLLLVIAHPGRAYYLSKKFEAIGSKTQIILLEDLLNYMPQREFKLPYME